MNSQNRKTPDPHRLLFNHSDKINIERSDKLLLYQNWAFTIHQKIYKFKKITINLENNKFKISAPTWNEDLNYLMDHILYQKFKVILNISSENIRPLLIILQHEYT